jgi:hypothetical protein
MIAYYVDYKTYQSMVVACNDKITILDDKTLFDKRMDYITGKDFNIDDLKYFNFENFFGNDVVSIVSCSPTIPIIKTPIYLSSFEVKTIEDLDCNPEIKRLMCEFIVAYVRWESIEIIPPLKAYNKINLIYKSTPIITFINLPFQNKNNPVILTINLHELDTRTKIMLKPTTDNTAYYLSLGIAGIIAGFSIYHLSKYLK